MPTTVFKRFKRRVRAFFVGSRKRIKRTRTSVVAVVRKRKSMLSLSGRRKSDEAGQEDRESLTANREMEQVDEFALPDHNAHSARRRQQRRGPVTGSPQASSSPENPTVDSPPTAETAEIPPFSQNVSTTQPSAPTENAATTGTYSKMHAAVPVPRGTASIKPPLPLSPLQNQSSPGLPSTSTRRAPPLAPSNKTPSPRAPPSTILPGLSSAPTVRPKVSAVSSKRAQPLGPSLPGSTNTQTQIRTSPIPPNPPPSGSRTSFPPSQTQPGPQTTTSPPTSSSRAPDSAAPKRITFASRLSASVRPTTAQQQARQTPSPSANPIKTHERNISTSSSQGETSESDNQHLQHKVVPITLAHRAVKRTSLPPPSQTTPVTTSESEPGMSSSSSHYHPTSGSLTAQRSASGRYDSKGRKSGTSDRDRDRERDREREKEREREREREREKEKDRHRDRDYRDREKSGRSDKSKGKERERAPSVTAVNLPLPVPRRQNPNTLSRSVRFRNTLLFSPTPPGSIPPSPAASRHSSRTRSPDVRRPAIPSFPPASSRPATSVASNAGSTTSPSARRASLTTSSTTTPSPQMSKKRIGWFNSYGDQLWTNNGGFVAPPPGFENPPDLAGYPLRGEGWMNDSGRIIDMQHRLVRAGASDVFANATQIPSAGYKKTAPLLKSAMKKTRV